MVRPLVSALGLVALAWTQQPAPQTDAAQVVADRLRTYLDSYERQIASVVAEERFVQSVILASGSPQRRRLASDVAFLRLPGDLEWLAHRAIRSADGRPVGQGRDALLNLLRQSGVASSAIARLMVDESASYNLGRERTVNVPTLPLDLLHPRHQRRFQVEWRGEGRRAGHPAVRLVFREFPPGAIIRAGSGYARTAVDAWIGRDSGALLEATVDAFEAGDGEYLNRVQVWFAHDAGLDLLVPTRMDERFRPQGRGRATYRNFRRFETSARILPPGR